MKYPNFKKTILLFLIVAIVVAASACSSGNNKTPQSNSAAETNAVKAQEGNPYELYIDKSFSWITDQVGELNYEYNWEGGDHYSAKDCDLLFAFPTYDLNDESVCSAINAPLAALFPDLAQKADPKGFLSAKKISDYFGSTYEYSYDDISEVGYVGVAYKQGSVTDKTYAVFFYPEDDGSCSTDSTIMVKIKN